MDNLETFTKHKKLYKNIPYILIILCLFFLVAYLIHEMFVIV
jgi:hypothetical protein